MTTAYPLSWPEDFPRKAGSREAGRFKTTLSGALKNVAVSIRLFGTDSNRPVTMLVLSSNVTLGADKPKDPGVAAWFLWDGEQRCIPVDRYDSVAANLQAIHHIVEARRVELRHGSLELVKASFKGFTLALAPPRPKTWREVFECPPDFKPKSADDIQMTYRFFARSRHPDFGGSEAAMAELNVARDQALKEFEGQS